MLVLIFYLINCQIPESGKYLPELIERENIEKINLLPPEITEKIIEDIKNKII